MFQSLIFKSTEKALLIRIQIWNPIPEHIRNANSLQQFRKGYLEWAANEDHSSLLGYNSNCVAKCLNAF